MEPAGPTRAFAVIAALAAIALLLLTVPGGLCFCGADECCPDDGGCTTECPVVCCWHPVADTGAAPAAAFDAPSGWFDAAASPAVEAAASAPVPPPPRA